MSAPNAPSESPVEQPTRAEVESQNKGVQKDTVKEVSVEITDIKASGLPAKVGLFSGLFYVKIKGGEVSRRTKTAKYVKGEEFVATWGESLKLSAPESSTVEIEVYARRFFFSFMVIKKTESKESLADLLEHTETPVELELLEEGKAAGRLVFRVSRSNTGAAPPQSAPASAGLPPPDPESPNDHLNGKAGGNSERD